MNTLLFFILAAIWTLYGVAITSAPVLIPNVIGKLVSIDGYFGRLIVRLAVRLVASGSVLSIPWERVNDSLELLCNPRLLVI
jgi:hypothetical protein